MTTEKKKMPAPRRLPADKAAVSKRREHEVWRPCSRAWIHVDGEAKEVRVKSYGRNSTNELLTVEALEDDSIRSARATDLYGTQEEAKNQERTGRFGSNQDVPDWDIGHRPWVPMLPTPKRVEIQQLLRASKHVNWVYACNQEGTIIFYEEKDFYAWEGEAKRAALRQRKGIQEPVDPDLAPWKKNDRAWTPRTGGSQEVFVLNLVSRCTDGTRRIHVRPVGGGQSFFVLDEYLFLTSKEADFDTHYERAGDKALADLPPSREEDKTRVTTDAPVQPRKVGDKAFYRRGPWVREVILEGQGEHSLPAMMTWVRPATGGVRACVPWACLYRSHTEAETAVGHGPLWRVGDTAFYWFEGKAEPVTVRSFDEAHGGKVTMRATFDADPPACVTSISSSFHRTAEEAEAFHGKAGVDLLAEVAAYRSIRWTVGQLAWTVENDDFGGHSIKKEIVTEVEKYSLVLRDGRHVRTADAFSSRPAAVLWTLKRSVSENERRLHGATLRLNDAKAKLRDYLVKHAPLGEANAPLCSFCSRPTPTGAHRPKDPKRRIVICDACVTEFANQPNKPTAEETT